MFQFYLSSIKRFWRNGRRRERKMFQFYLSSIKSIVLTPLGTIDTSFNSTLVQLKVADHFNAQFKSYVFQFYLSSIKSQVGCNIQPFFLRFQFYLSSIKRNWKMVTNAYLTSFNSTLVQLKDLLIKNINIK